MQVLLDKPMRYLTTDTDFWVVLERAAEYQSTSSPRRRRVGEFIENLFSYTHVTAPELGITDMIHAYVGTNDGDVGILYDWQNDANVAQSLRTIAKYEDFYSILGVLGYEQEDAVVITAVQQLQIKVNNAREAAGLPT